MATVEKVLAKRTLCINVKNGMAALKKMHKALEYL